MTQIERIREHAKPLEVKPTYVEPRLKWLPQIRTVVFDIYGTLVISASGDIGLVDETNREGATLRAMDAIGLHPKKSVDDLSQRYHSLLHENRDQRKAEGIEYPEVEILDIWQALVSQLAIQQELEKVPEEIDIEALAIEYESRTNPTWPMPGAQKTLETLRDRGFPMGIVSNAQFYTPLLFPALMENSLEQLGFREELQVYSFQEREGKPSTALYEILSKKLDPSTVLYVGNDMRNDIWPAQKVGFVTALFAGDERSLRWREDDPNVEGVKPDLIVTRLPQLLECLPDQVI